MKGVLSGKATSTIKGLYRLECPWISGKAIRIDLWYCLSGNGFLIDIASVSTSISAIVTFDCTFCKNGKIACVYKTWNSHWITWQNDEELRKCQTPIEYHGKLLPRPHICPLSTYGNSPLCPTGHWPFGAAALLSIHFFSWSLQAGHRVPLTMCDPWMTSSPKHSGNNFWVSVTQE